MSKALPLMVEEAREAPRVVARQFAENRSLVEALAARLRAAPPAFVVTCARGSSDHAATYGKYLIETRLGFVTASAAPSVASVYRRPLRLERALFLAISQSGRSEDLFQVTRQARAGGALVVALVNDAGSPLAGLADAVLPLRAGREESVAATKSFIASLAGLLHLVAAWSEDPGLWAALDRLPAQLARAAELDWSALTRLLTNRQELIVLGRGRGLGIAQEAALKFKETCRLQAEAFSAAELRHGPLTLVGPGYPLLAFSQSDESRPGLQALLAELRGQGASVLVAEDGEPSPGRLPTLPDLLPCCAPLAMIQSFYIAVAGLALARGLDPDQPRHLQKVTVTR